MDYLSLEEVCDRVGLTKNQLGYLIKYKHIEPINMATWKADGGYRFEQGDVEKLEELYKDSLTLKKTTERLYLKKDLEIFKERIENRSKEESKEKKQHLSLYLDEKVVEAIKKKAAKKGYNGYKKFAEDILSAEVKEDIEE